MAYVNSSENMPPDNLATVAFLDRFRQTALAALTGTQYQHEVQFVDKVVQKLDAGISLAKVRFQSMRMFHLILTVPESLHSPMCNPTSLTCRNLFAVQSLARSPPAR